MPQLSVAIITRNEETNLARTLESVRFAGEIVVVDSGSADRTLEIAGRFGARIFREPWRGFAAQKNFAISQCRGTWVLSLDADEELSPELQAQLRTLLPTNPPFDAFYLRRRNLFLGRWMRHGGYYPDPKLRLFRRNAVSFAPFGERPVHETIAFDGAFETLDFDLIHHAYPTLEEYLEHMDRYSSLGARHPRRAAPRQPLAARLPLECPDHPGARASSKTSSFRLGFLDGREGLLLHLYHAAYVSWKYSKSWEAWRQAEHPGRDPHRRAAALGRDHAR